MKRQILTAAVLTSLCLTACKDDPKRANSDNQKNVTAEIQTETKVSDIAFTVAQNYFVKNTVKNLEDPKIETAEKFNEIFGMATTMGKDGKPTEIDFKKQYVIAVILAETDVMTTVKPVRLQKDEQGKITLLYKTSVGQKQSFSTRPSLEIIVDKSDSGTIVLKEQE